MKFTEEIKAFIAANVEGITNEETTRRVNERFGTDFTEASVKSFKTKHGFKSGRRGIPVGRPSKKYPDEIQQYIAKNYKGVGPKEMTDRLNATFCTNYTHNQIKTWYHNHKLNSGLDGFFARGSTPYNKGQRGVCPKGCEASWFEKGNRPHNWVPIGTERINSDGYAEIKVQEGKKQKNWKGKHILIWEEANGPVPKGHVVIFGDRDKNNFEVSNLILVTRAQLARLNQNKLIRDDADLTRTGVIIADLITAVSKRVKKKAKVVSPD